MSQIKVELPPEPVGGHDRNGEQHARWKDECNKIILQATAGKTVKSVTYATKTIVRHTATVECEEGVGKESKPYVPQMRTIADATLENHEKRIVAIEETLVFYNERLCNKQEKDPPWDGPN